MTSAVISTASFSSVTLNTNEYLLVTKEGTLYGVTDLVSIGAGQRNVNVFVSGAVAAVNGSAFDFDGSGQHTVRIDASGSIQAEGRALSFGDLDFYIYVQNAGTISGGTGISVETPTSVIANTGTINAGIAGGTGVTGDAILFGNGGSLTNSGTITAGLRGIKNFSNTTQVDIINSGLIHGDDEGIESNWGLELHNSGTVSSQNVAIRVFDGNGLIYNTGTIQGDIEAVSSDEFAFYGTTGTVTGEIRGSVEGRNWIYGGGNRDEIEGGEVRDVLVGGGGDDVLRGFEGADKISGGDGDDEIFGGDGADFLSGQDGDDTIAGNTGDDRIYGGTGDDRLVDFEGGNDIMRGGAGDDILNSFGGNDDLRAGIGNDFLIAGSGDDDLFGEDGDDDLDGGAGIDTLRGGNGNDILRFDGFDTLVNGGAGEDTVVKTDDIRIDLIFGSSTFKNVEHIDAFDKTLDRVRTDDGDNTVTIGSALTLDTYGGNDDVRFEVTALRGDVALDRGDLGAGNDTFYSQGRVRFLELGDGDDFAQVLKSSIIYGGRGDDVMEALSGSGIEGLTFWGNSGNDRLIGGVSSDSLRGNQGDDVLIGGSGRDSLDGGNNNDLLLGQNDDDFLNGGSGNDILIGGEGDDRLTGGTGRDTFVFEQGAFFDRVLDFEDGVDRINLRDFGYASAADALSHFFQQGTNVRIVDGSDVMVISNALLSDFDASDLIL